LSIGDEVKALIGTSTRTCTVCWGMDPADSLEVADGVRTLILAREAVLLTALSFNVY
jgi:hypothetical protein